MTLDRKMLPSIHGRRFGISRSGTMIVDGTRIAVPSWQDRGGRCIHFDHFVGAALEPTWIATLKGSDGSAAVPAILADQVGGRVKLTTGAGATLTMAVNGCQLVGNKNFDAAKGGLEFGAAVQMAAITTICTFIGFADADTLQMPFTISGDTITANATNAHGFLFDTAATAATWKVIGVANGGTPVMFDTGIAPVAATDDLVKTEIDPNTGNLNAWLNGTQVVSEGTGYAYQTAGGLLTPTFATFRRSAASTTASADFIYAAQDR